MGVYVCYVDESGVPEPSKPGHFVLLGLVVGVSDWKSLDEEIRQCMRAVGIPDHEELHAGVIARSYNEQDSIPGFRHLNWQQRRSAVEDARCTRIASLKAKDDLRIKATKKLFRLSEPYIHLGLGERRQLLAKIASCISRWENVSILCQAIDKRYYYSASRPPLIERAFAGIVHRFEEFLATKARVDKQATNGFIVQDNNQTVASRLTEMMIKMHARTDRARQIKRIIETPLFVDSRLTRMVQLADLCAFAVRRFFDTSDHDLFDRIYRSFHRSTDALLGIRHISHDDCKCRVCKQTGIQRVQVNFLEDD